MNHLYRVVPLADWHEALRTGSVPRCASDERHDRVHLNSLEDVELAANLWFAPEEEPVVLEIDLADLAPHIKWEARAELPKGVWPNLYAKAVPAQSVVRVLALEQKNGDGGSRTFRIGAALSGHSHRGVAAAQGAP
jgi:uncharacterized protein (DUF952 family)